MVYLFIGLQMKSFMSNQKSEKISAFFKHYDKEAQIFRSVLSSSFWKVWKQVNNCIRVQF